MTLPLTAVLDTNWFIGVANATERQPPLPVHSIVTRLELLSAPDLDDVRLARWERRLDASAEYGLTTEIAYRAAALRRSHGGRLPDAVIAATAAVHGLPVLTRDRGMLRYRDAIALPALDQPPPSAATNGIARPDAWTRASKRIYVPETQDRARSGYRGE